ncbi:1-aminocyclopropane-1-carboxylate deaminase [Acrocarpospora phusangensis]|uniref:1-aminocyclopropane-1-carboxylate deaminase n=1 Tax=Acrocarpospora phusangensis TaxID=1070424 RepID=A0A919QL07_9ACTN|nr:pyridoxal-phosphate dependent enzyme [Acrocarpospora phusangensis]GIH28240.1 1-aminocyclopropane-1-carboxylate deaminase [Acrocarpospora phusangensis]
MSEAVSPVVPLEDDRTGGVRVWLKRDDLIGGGISGNKWRKLKYNVGAGAVVTFGGAYSSHVRAVAVAGEKYGFATAGVIRGEERLPLNPVLDDAVRRGMRLRYLDRTTYRLKHTTEVLEWLRGEYPGYRILPEGGSNPEAVRGCMELPGEITVPFDVICCPVGTGGTLAGIAAGLTPGRRAIGFSALRGGSFLNDEVARLQRETLGETTPNWHIETDYHFGGYARTNAQLSSFIDDFHDRHGILLDRVYVAKMMYGVFDLIESGAFASGTALVAVVTGGPDLPR